MWKTTIRGSSLEGRERGKWTGKRDERTKIRRVDLSKQRCVFEENHSLGCYFANRGCPSPTRTVRIPKMLTGRRFCSYQAVRKLVQAHAADRQTPVRHESAQGNRRPDKQCYAYIYRSGASIDIGWTDEAGWGGGGGGFFFLS